MSKKSKPKRKTTKIGKIRNINSKRLKTKTQSGRGPGKPTISDAELTGQRDHWAFALESYWGEVGWDLKCARTAEDIRIALQPLSKGPDLYPLNLLLRTTVAEVLAGAIQETRKKLGLCGERLPGVYERQRKAREAFQKAEWAVLELSEKTRQHLRAEIERRNENIRELKIKISDKKAEIRRKELALKNASQQDRPSVEAELKSIESELEKIEAEILAENDALVEIKKRLRAVTPEKQKLADKVYAECQSERDAADQEASEAAKERKELEESLANQQAHYCQHELLKFIRGRRYSHASRKLANAIAGLPDISCRQSAMRCAKIPYTWKPDYSFFEFAEETWRGRIPSQSKPEQILDLFRNAIAALPRTLLGQPGQDGKRKKLDNYFRSDLCGKWLYLKQAIQDALRATYTLPDKFPYLITAKFKDITAKPRTAADELFAAQDKLEV